MPQSEAVVGSVMANAPSRRPAAMGGSKRARCWSLPKVPTRFTGPSPACVDDMAAIHGFTVVMSATNGAHALSEQPLPPI